MGWIADLLKEIPSAARYKAELEEMERENGILKEKVSALESEISDLRQKIQRRDDIIQNDKFHNNLLDDVKVKILMFLANRTTPIVVDYIAPSVGIEPQTALFHLEELKKMKMVHVGYMFDAPPNWTLGQEGRRYLIEHKKIS